jgi:hypothetical protein
MSPTEIAVRAYAAAWQEPDDTIRAQMIDAFFAEDGRLVTGGTPICGRAALAKMMATFRADPRGMTARLVEPLDVQGRLFRFRAVVEHRDGTVAESFDAGEVDADGRISTLLTFNGHSVERSR